MYSDFFDPPDDDAAADMTVSEADKIEEGTGYSSSDEKTCISDEQDNNTDKEDEACDDHSVKADEQPPVKKAKHNLLTDE